MTWTTGIPNKGWDKQLFARGGPFTQSSHWAAVQAALGREVFFASGEGWQCLAVLEIGKGSRRMYAPYGPVLSRPAALRECLQALRRLAIRHNAQFARLEPSSVVKTTTLKNTGLFSALRDTQPRFTWVKDLTKSEDEILMEMTPTNRNLYRTAHKKGLTFYTSQSTKDLPIFLNMLHEVSAITGMRPHSDDEFYTIAGTLMPRKAATLYIAQHDGKPVASALVYDSPTTRYYAHAAAYNEARKLHPGSPLLSTMIFDAKNNGQKEFDFFGVAPPDQPNHKWAGFTKFKKSFGGDYKEFSGTWELPVNKFGYAKYRLLLKAHQLLR